MTGAWERELPAPLPQGTAEALHSAAHQLPPQSCTGRELKPPADTPALACPHCGRGIPGPVVFGSHSPCPDGQHLGWLGTGPTMF